MAHTQVTPAPPLSPEWSLILRALYEFAGFARGVAYDVPRGEAPASVRYGSIYLRGSPAWERFLAARRQVDSTELKVLLALRQLGDDERFLVVDWGSSHANTFLLVEPYDPACDLTNPANPLRQRVEAATRALLREGLPDDDVHPWTRTTALGELVRGLFGTWTYWTSPRPALATRQVTLRPARPGETLADLLLPQLPVRFTRAAFERALAELLHGEMELFNGPVSRARLPFCTRLGLPILHNPRYVDHALRHLVNAGRTTVYQYDVENFARYDGDNPLPETMSDDEFEQLSL